MKGLYPLRIRGPSRCIIAGSFVTVASNSPTVLRGQGFSVVRENTGLYTVTVDTPVNAFDSIVATVHAKTEGTELYAAGDIDALTTSVFKLRLSTDGGTLTDDAGTLVSFIAAARIGNHNA